MTTSGLRGEERERHVVVRLTGELDIATAGTIGGQVRRSVQNHTYALALDVSDVTYVDSAGVRLLFDLAAELRARRQELLVVAPPESPVARVLTIVAFDRVAVVAEDLDTALAQVRMRPREGEPPL